MAVLCSEIWLLIGVVFVLQLPVIRSQLCQQYWTFHAPTVSCMRLLGYNYGYSKARQHCETYSSSSNTKGKGHLVFIFDKVTDDFVKGLLDEHRINRGLIGLNDRSRNGDYAWGDSSPIPVNYTGWADKPHTADPNKQAVVMTKYGWQEYGEGLPACFVCQVNVDLLQPTTPWMQCPVAKVGQESPDITCRIYTHPLFTITSVRFMQTAAVVASCDVRGCWSSQVYQHVDDVRKSQETRNYASWSLKLRNVTISAETDWTCSVEFNNNGSWIVSQPCSLEVYNFPPPRMVCPVARIGQKSPDITCTIDTHPTFMITSVRFMKTAEVVASCDILSCWSSQEYQHVADLTKTHVRRSSDTWTLKLKNVTISDETDWACSVQFNNVDSWVASQPCSLKVYRIPKISRIPTISPNNPKVGDSEVKITCLATGLPEPTYEFRKGDNNIPEEHVDEQNGILTINDLKREDEGVYTCVAKNRVGSDEKSTHLDVRVAPIIQPISGVMDAVEGGRQRVTCMAEGDPAPTVIWHKQGQLPYTNDDIKHSGPNLIDEAGTDREDAEIKIVGKTMDFTPIEPQDAGTYTCTAINLVGNASTTVKFEVRYKPNFDTDYKVTTFYGWRGRRVNLTCLASANEVATIKWYEIKDNQTVFIETEGPFTNREPQVWPDYYLSSSSLLVDVSDDASPVFKDYTCEATNSLGSAKQTVTLRRALTPGQAVVYVSSTLPTKITFEIDIPKENGGQPVTGYHYIYRVDTAGAIPIEGDIESTHETTNLELTDMKPNTQYILRVHARNAVGLGTETPVTVQTKEVSLPGKLELLSPAEGPKPTSYTFKWADVDNGDSPVTDIVIKYRRVLVTGTDPSQWQISGDVDKSYTIVKVPNVKSTSYTLSGLERDTHYDIRITAINKEGESPETFQIIRTSRGDLPTPRMVCPIAEVGQESPDITCTIDTHPSLTVINLRIVQTAAVVASCDGRRCLPTQGYQHVIDVRKSQVTRSSVSWSVKMRNVTKSAETDWRCYVKFNNGGSWVASQPCSLKVYNPVSTDSKNGGSQAQDVGAIVGCIVAALLAIIIFGVLIFLWRKKGAPCTRKKHQHANTPMYAVFKNDKPGSRHVVNELTEANAPANPQ